MQAPERASDADRAASGLGTRLDAMAKAVDACAERLPEPLVERAREVLGRAGERRRLSSDHTVVAFAGATGSGKSSLFNAVAGLELARVGVRRPTTAEPLACVWGANGASALLDWLEIPRRHRVARESPLEPGAEEPLLGLVLLDLPDHDSTAVAHRLEVDRLVGLVDVFVWVVDPQKYADAVLHERYLQPLARHAPVTAVVLNQVDRLPAADIDRCVADIERLLADDGMRGVKVLPMSARTGEGVDELINLLRETVSARRAATERLAADLSKLATELVDAIGDGDPKGVTKQARERLVAALAEAAGVEAVAHAVASSYRLHARAVTGWPPTRWLSRLRRDPVRRFRLDREVAPRLVRTSLPAPTPVQRARAESAVRAFGDEIIEGAPRAWADAVRAVGRKLAERLPDTLDQAIAGADLQSRPRPVWWRLVGLLQWSLLAAAVVGLGWLAVLFALNYLQLPEPATPEVAGIPVPTWLLFGGVVLGLVLAMLARLPTAIGAGRHARIARRQLRLAVGKAADTEIVEPMATEVDRLVRCREAVRDAAQG